MPLAPAIAASLNAGLTARRKGLYLDGLDVLKQGTAQVNPASLKLTMAGAGQVSRLVFTLRDPDKLLTPREGQWVRFVDFASDQPLFVGWVENIRYDVLGIGRSYEISCVGAEAVLDWMYVPSMTFAAFGPTVADAAQSLCAAATAIGAPLNVASLSTSGSKIANPVAGVLMAFQASSAITSPAGSLRRALEYTVNAMFATGYGDPETARTVAMSVTVDRWWGLRIWAPRAVGTSGIVTAGGFGDHSTFDINTATPGQRPSTPSIGYSQTDTPRGVYVRGSGVSALVTDGTGIPGRIASITDPGTTAAQVQAAGIAWLARQGPLLTGSFVLEGFGLGGPSVQLDALSPVLYTDTVLGLSGVSTYITSLTIVWSPSDETTWDISFGATLVSAAAYLRSLTQDQLI